MKIIFLGITWNFAPIIALLYIFIGALMIGLIFFVDRLGWWNVPYVLCLIVYLASLDHISKKIEGIL